MLAMVPINNVALGTLAPERVKNASGLFNLMRNLGGAVGLAALNTVLNDRMDLHLARLHEAVTWSRGAGGRDARQHDGAVLRASAATPRRWRSSSSPSSCTSRRAVMAFADVFLMLTVVFVALAVGGLAMKRPAAPAGGAGGH